MLRKIAFVVLVGCTKQPPPAPAPVVTSASAVPVASTVTVPPVVVEAGVDSIDKLVKKLETQPLWTNGLFPKIDLPEGANPDSIAKAVFGKTSFEKGKVTRHTIVDSRKVKIAPDTREYLALVLDTDQGKKIMLLQWQGSGTGWWSRVFDP